MKIEQTKIVHTQWDRQTYDVMKHHMITTVTLK